MPPGPGAASESDLATTAEKRVNDVPLPPALLQGLSARSGYQDVKPDPHAYMDVRPDPHSIADEDDSDGELAV